MASLFKQPKSKFYFVRFRNPVTGKTERKSTKLVDWNRAKRIEAEYTFQESRISSASPREHWNNWVLVFFNTRYGDDPTRANGAWRNLEMFFKEREIQAPRQITREHAAEYIAWRSQPNKSKKKYKAGRNTVILEIKFMSIILDEATRRQYITHNPWLKLGLFRERPLPKPELPRHALAVILSAIRKLPDLKKRRFFLHSFLIARYHGCRLSETYFNPLTQVQFGRQNLITFNAKGNVIHTVHLHPRLMRRFKRLHAEGCRQTYDPPKSPAKEWFKFLSAIGIKKRYPGACFHSLRVTAATILARKGISEKKAMDYIGHASTTVHRAYVHLNADDLSVCADALT